MRIAHVNFAVEESVDQKLARFAECAETAGLEMVVVNFSQHAPPVSRGNLRVHALPGRRLCKKIAPKVQWPFRLFFAARVVRTLEVDAVILRYPKLPLGWSWFLRWVRVPVITEHHTDEVAEILGDGSLPRRAAAAVERHLRKRFLRRVGGFIAVTPEILQAVQVANPNAPRGMIPNGIPVDTIPFCGFRPFDGQELSMIFVASEFVYWHGLDRLLEGMLRYRGGCVLRLTLLGTVPDAYDALLERCREHPAIRVECPGPVYGDARHVYFENVNLAFASLGLFRKNMEQACPLKSREYIARGLPFVYGYTDPEIPDDAPYALRVPNTSDPVEMNSILEFAAAVSLVPSIAEKMRNRAEHDLDIRRKILEMFCFAEAVCASK